ncbi:uncharacterized protein KIAA2012 homolog isoform X3 [Dermochelys coriacea]|uniref:uncharacterized protein KIAA2012 homolog isoform X3 n=1 Tax=Dermochelys coriacea TaxID=27794 RepID=UPI0018E8A140|nr:uncharacterized protein KIAA2012 homolog isoform X3 [Dermochelys coriacea]
MPNLSLLSRGTGQVVKKNQEKLEVHFEPEDYLNWKSHEGHCHVNRLLNEKQFMKGCWGLYLPKTYSTKTGALVLYSEDLAEPSWKQRGGRSGQQGLRHRRNKLQIELHTLQDLTRAILAYGGRQKDQKGTAWHPHLHFLKKPDNQIDRQIRPGYSAKRYLFRLSQTWDPSIIYRLQCAGYIRDPLLLQENSLNIPNHRIGQQDLSAVPKKYHLLPVFPSFWAELSQHIHPGIVAGQSYSFQKEAENRENLVEGDEVKTHGRRRARVPVRVSVRRLSLELRPPPAKEATWNQNAACARVPQGTEVEEHQDVERAMEGQWHREKPHQTESQEHCEKLNQTVKSSVGNATIDTSQLLSERSYMTFYGGYFPGRKKPYSIKQGHLNKQDGKEEGHLIETGFFPPIQSAMDSEQGVVRVEHRKQAPETLKFPSISEELPRAQVPHRKQFKSSDPPKELLILPLLIQLQTQPTTEAKNQTAPCDKSRSEVDDDCEKLLAPSPNDLISGPEGTTEQHQMVIGANPEIHQGIFFLPPITNRKFTLEGRKAGIRGVNAGKEGHYKRDGDLFTQNAVPGLDLLPPIYGKKSLGNHSSKTNFKTFSSSTSKTLPIGITRGTLPEELRECYNGTSLGSLIMGPDGEIVCLSLLGSVQDADVPAQFSFVPDKEDYGLPLETGTSLHINPHETSPLSQKMNDKKCSESLGAAVLKKGEPQSFINKKLEVTLPLEAAALKKGDSGVCTAKRLEIRTQQGYRHCIENEHKVGNGGSVPEFKEEIEHGQYSLSGHLRLTQDQQTKLYSGSLIHSNDVTQTLGAKQQEDCNFVKDPGKQMNGAPGSHSNSHLGSYGGHTVSLTEEMGQDSESGNYLMGPSSHKVMLQENVGVAMSHSEKQHGTEGEKTTLLKELCKQTTASISAFQDTEVAKNKIMKKQRNELTKMDPVSKAQKKSSNKDKQHSREEFVVGKPKQKKADEKRTSSLKKKTTRVKRQGTIQESKHKEGRQKAEEADQSSAAAEDEELCDDRSPSPSSSPIKDHLLSPESPRFCFEDYGNPSGSSPVSVHKKFTQTHPIITTVSGTELDAGISNEVSEDRPGKQQEEKLSRDRMRAEKAERRRLEVERKRREQEEQKWKKQEQQERMEKIKEELEQEQKRRVEEMSLRKQELEEQHRRQEEEAARKLQHEKAAQERIRQQQEEYRRKLLALQKKRQQEERERAEAEKHKQKEREMWLEMERQRLAEMAEEERLEYERRKLEEEEQARREAEETRKKAEAATRLALEEAKTQAQLLARQREALKQHLQFQRELLVEASGLEHTQQISRPWVYSYFQLLQMLGPETAKENK